MLKTYPTRGPLVFDPEEDAEILKICRETLERSPGTPKDRRNDRGGRFPEFDESWTRRPNK